MVRRCACVVPLFSRDTTTVVAHNVGRVQRGLWPADNESLGNTHAGTSSDEPLKEEDARREEAERSAVATDTPGRIDAWSAVGIDTPSDFSVNL